MKPFAIVLIVLNGSQTASIPNFPIVQKMRARDLRLIDLFPPQMQHRLKTVGRFFNSLAMLLQTLQLNFLRDNLKHIDLTDLKIIRATFQQLLLYFVGLESRG